MEQKEAFRKYLLDLNSLLNEELEGKYYQTLDDSSIAYELFKAKVNPIKVLEVFMTILKESPKERLSLRDLRPFLRELTEKEQEGKAITPYERVSKLISYLKYLFAELGVEEDNLIRKLEKLLEEEELFKIEGELYRIEEELFKLLEANSPFYQECLKRALKATNRFSFYWKGKVLEITRKAIIKKCLREKHGIPEFSAL